MKRVLILCTGNSCRSQMAEGWWRHLGGEDWEVASAGSKPAGYVHHLAVRAMQEAGIDISQATSKSLEQFREQPFDLVITVCGNANDACPTFPGAAERLHWPFVDPYHAPGDDEEKMVRFREVRDQIRAKIAEHLESR